MKLWMQGKDERDPRAFGERFAWRMVMLFSGMAVYMTFGSIIGGRPIAILATLIGIGCDGLPSGGSTSGRRIRRIDPAVISVAWNLRATSAQ